MYVLVLQPVQNAQAQHIYNLILQYRVLVVVEPAGQLTKGVVLVSKKNFLKN
jgi:hypothetical protein